MTAATFPARWTTATAVGLPDGSGHKRLWTMEDAERLATRGEILTPAGALKLGVHGRVVHGRECRHCKQPKVVATAAAQGGAWCFGCGRAA